MGVSKRKIAYGEKQNMVPLVRNPDLVKKDFPGISVWPWSKRNLAKLSDPKYSEIRQRISQLDPGEITRISASKQFLLRISALDLSRVTETDVRACIQPRTFFPGNVLNLDNIQRVKRGPIQVLGNIIGGWLRLKFPRKTPKYDYAFMVHPRNWTDVLGGAPFLKFLPKKWGVALVKRFPPFKLSNITGLKDENGKPLTGAIVCIGWDLKMFESDLRGREQKIADMVKLVKNMGAKYAGFAGLLAWASRYGRCLEGTVSRKEIEKIIEGEKVRWEQLARLFENPADTNLKPKPLAEVKDAVAQLDLNRNKKRELLALFQWADRVGQELNEMHVTTGHPFTVAILSSMVNKVIGLHPKKNPLVAIVGAAGSTGSCCCRQLAKDGVNNLLLVDREKSSGVTDLSLLSSEIAQLNRDATIKTSVNLEDLKQAEIIVVVSSSDEVLINAEHLKPGAIVIDDTQPRNVSPKIVEERKDIRVITVLAQIKGLIPNYSFDKHIPLTDVVFTCVGDIIARLLTRTTGGSTGPADMASVQRVMEMARQIEETRGFNPLEPIFTTYLRQFIPDDDLVNIARLTLTQAPV